MYAFGASLWAAASALTALEVIRHSPLSIRRSCFSLIPAMSLLLSPACSRTLLDRLQLLPQRKCPCALFHERRFAISWRNGGDWRLHRTPWTCRRGL